MWSDAWLAITVSTSLPSACLPTLPGDQPQGPAPVWSGLHWPRIHALDLLFLQLFCHILSSSTSCKGQPVVLEWAVYSGGPSPRPWSCQVLCGGRSDGEQAAWALAHRTPASLWCWNFLSDFHFPLPLPSETETLFNCTLWSAIQDIIILIKCFLWSGAWASAEAFGAACPGLIIGSNSAVCRRPESRLPWPLRRRLSWTPLHCHASKL